MGDDWKSIFSGGWGDWVKMGVIGLGLMGAANWIGGMLFGEGSILGTLLGLAAVFFVGPKLLEMFDNSSWGSMFGGRGPANPGPEQYYRGPQQGYEGPVQYNARPGPVPAQGAELPPAPYAAGPAQSGDVVVEPPPGTPPAPTDLTQFLPKR